VKLVGVAALGALSLLCAGGSAANVITGRLWHVPEAVSLNAVVANVPLRTPDVVFDVQSPIDFFGDEATVATWLASSHAFNIVENTSGVLASAMDGPMGGTQLGTLVEFRGYLTVVNGAHFTVTHDDGLSLIIGGLDLEFDPTPTSPIVSDAVYTGPSGTFEFTLVYGECCSAPAVLQIDLPFSNSSQRLPESSTLALVGVALAGAGEVLSRRRR
jgi:hypothetical protein